LTNSNRRVRRVRVARGRVSKFYKR